MRYDRKKRPRLLILLQFLTFSTCRVKPVHRRPRLVFNNIFIIDKCPQCVGLFHGNLIWDGELKNID